MRLSLSVLLKISASALLSITALAAKADTLTTFTLQGSIYQASGSLDGTLIINTTTGEAVSGHFTLVADGNAYTIESAPNHTYNYPQDEYTSINFSATDGTSDIDIDLPVSTLIGYAGGQQCSVYGPDLCGYRGTDLHAVRPGTDQYYFLALGTASPTTITPEPSSIALLGTGLLGVAGILRKRLS